jgi:Na+/proline symporter
MTSVLQNCAIVIVLVNVILFGMQLQAGRDPYTLFTGFMSGVMDSFFVATFVVMWLKSRFPFRWF